MFVLAAKWIGERAMERNRRRQRWMETDMKVVCDMRDRQAELAQSEPVDDRETESARLVQRGDSGGGGGGGSCDRSKTASGDTMVV